MYQRLIKLGKKTDVVCSCVHGMTNMDVILTMHKENGSIISEEFDNIKKIVLVKDGIKLCEIKEPCVIRVFNVEMVKIYTDETGKDVIELILTD